MARRLVPVRHVAPKEGPLKQVDGGEIGQRVGEQGLGHQEQVDDDTHGVAGQVVGDHLLGGKAEGQETDIGETGFKNGCSHVRPVDHAMEFALVYQIALQGGQEDLRGVAEDDDAQRDGEGPYVDLDLHVGPVPLAGAREAVYKNDEVDEHVGHRTPEGQVGHVAQ